MSKRSASRREGERGSALLVVLIMAAFVAILLYRELPVASFEKQREKEQQLIDRGNEYSQAVRIYIRRVGQYPPTIDALEDTNNMRFLRHRFKDPFTGQDDWRVLHAGPGGVLMDSKVRTASLNEPNSPGNFEQHSMTETTGSAGDVVIPALRKRPPAISAGNGESAASMSEERNGSQAALNSDPTSSLLPSASSDAVLTGATNADAAGSASTTPRGAGTAGQSFGGGIAGVASRAEGHAIKTVNEQTDYALWEFYYDPAKDWMRLLFNMRPTGGQILPGDPITKGAPGTGTGAAPSSGTIGLSAKP